MAERSVDFFLCGGAPLWVASMGELRLEVPVFSVLALRVE